MGELSRIIAGFICRNSVISLALSCLFFGTADPAVAQEAAAPYRIVLLGARWCAPCMAEYANLPALVGAAAPDRIVLAWVDRPIPVPAAVQGQVDIMPAAQARQLAESRLGEGFGLPAALVLSRACPPWRGPLRAQDLAAWRASCAVARH